MEKNLKRTEILEKDGWTKQFTANEPRLSEAIELYKTSGFEVHLEPLDIPEKKFDLPMAPDSGECRVCYSGTKDQYMTIFTRPAKDIDNLDNNELF